MRHIQSFIEKDPNGCKLTSVQIKCFSVLPLRSKLYRRQTVSIDFSIKIKSEHISHARYINLEQPALCQ
jgi:hypothetical protein